MTSARRIVTILGTLFAALGTGFVMQTVLQSPAPRSDQGALQVASVGGVETVTGLASQADTPAEEIALVPADAGDDFEFTGSAVISGVPVPPSTAPEPELLPDEPVTLAALDDQPITPLPQEEPAPSFACDITLDAAGTAAAMVELSLMAPCLVNERFTLHHNGMMFSAVTDAEGQARLMVPALAETAVFIATFTSGESVVATTDVTTLEYYDRAVVQWGGPEGLQIHALEYGADYGGAGHVWAGAAHDLSTAAKGEGGFILRLGDADLFNPLLAEVYTFPTGTALRGGSVSLSLEAEVTEANCGQDIEAQVLQKSGTGQMQARELMLAMPGCDGVGDILVLKNLFHDLNIAGN